MTPGREERNWKLKQIILLDENLHSFNLFHNIVNITSGTPAVPSLRYSFYLLAKASLYFLLLKPNPAVNTSAKDANARSFIGIVT